MPDEDTKKLSGAEEYVAAEIELAQPLEAEQEKKVRDALEKLHAGAITSCDIGTKKISLSYDPTRTSKADLLQLIKQAGGQLGNVESESSPML